MTYPKLCFKEIQVRPKIMVPGTSLWNFAPNSGFRKFFPTASRRCGQQKSSTLEPVHHAYDGRSSVLRLDAQSLLHAVVDCNPVTPITSICSGFLVQLLCSSWENFDPHIAWRGLSAAAELLVESWIRHCRVSCSAAACLLGVIFGWVRLKATGDRRRAHGGPEES